MLPSVICVQILKAGYEIMKIYAIQKMKVCVQILKTSIIAGDTPPCEVIESMNRRGWPEAAYMSIRKNKT